jgi:hypothetical protein
MKGAFFMTKRKQQTTKKIAEKTTYKVMKDYDTLSLEQAKYEIEPTGWQGKIRNWEKPN